MNITVCECCALTLIPLQHVVVVVVNISLRMRVVVVRNFRLQRCIAYESYIRILINSVRMGPESYRQMMTLSKQESRDFKLQYKCSRYLEVG